MSSDSLVDNVHIGSRFAGRYELLSVLGQGAMGKVFAARDTMLNNTLVALKVLNPNLHGDEAHLQRFLREVQVTREIMHPNVVRTFDVGTVDNMPYFTMEYLEGQTLEQAIKNKELQTERSITIIKAIAEALAAIHEKNVIHRDLKPANIILTNSGNVKLMDFGIARPEVSKLTAVDELVGSATHMAPEIWKQSETTYKVDLYGLGIVAYEMLTGLLPFDGTTAYEIMWKHLKHDCVPIREQQPDVPVWLATLVASMLAKEPSDRPHSAKEIVSRLELQELGDVTPDLFQKPAPESPKTAAPSPYNPFRTMLNRNALRSVRKSIQKSALSKGSKRAAFRKRKSALAKIFPWLCMLCMLAGAAAWYVHQYMHLKF